MSGDAFCTEHPRGIEAHPAVCKVDGQRRIVRQRLFKADPGRQILELAAQAAAARDAQVERQRLVVGATETPQQREAVLGVGAVRDGRCRRVAQPELAPALVVEQAMARFDMERAALLVVAAARGAHAQQAERVRARVEARQRVPQQLVRRDAPCLRGRQPLFFAHIDDPVTTRRSARERGHHLDSQRQPPRADLASQQRAQAVGIAAVAGGVARLGGGSGRELAERQRAAARLGPLAGAALGVPPASEDRELCTTDALGELRLELELERPLGIQRADRAERLERPSGALERRAQRTERGRRRVTQREPRALSATAGREPGGGRGGGVLGPTAPQQIDALLRQRDQRVGIAKREWPEARRASRLGAAASMRAVALHSLRVYDRAYLLAIFTLAYVAVAAIRYAGARADALAALVLGPLLLGAVWRRTRLAEGVSADVHPVALAAQRYAVWGAALWVAARTGPPGRPGFDLAANVGLGLSMVAAQVSLARIPGREGLVRAPRSAHALDAAGFSALVWGAAIALPALRTFWRGQGVLLDPLASDYATSAASIASVLILLGAALRMRHVRRLELGVFDRASGAVALTGAALSVAVPAAIADLAPPDRALPLGALAAGLACTWAATTPQATRVATGLRGALVVMVLGAPIALAAAAAAQHAPAHAGLITLGGASATLAVGILARSLAKPLTAEQSRWLEALEAAGRAAREPDPEAAVVATLVALSRIEGDPRVRPELWRAEPGEVLTVDVAGYLHTERAAAPAELYRLALEEPEQLLRRDVLAELQVRRPEVRPLLGWMDARDAFFVAVVSDEALPLALLSFPKGSRSSPLSLQEALAARDLCARLSAVLALSSSIARSRQREASARERADELVLEAAKLEALVELRSRPRDDVLDHLAASAGVAAFSARARAALEALAQHARAGRDVALELPVGVDALGYAALVHASGPQRGGPFVVLDGTEASAHEPSRYRTGGDTPLERARGGTLLLLNVASLPSGAQDALAVALSERAPGAGGAAFAFVASAPRPVAELLDGGQLTRALGRLLLPGAVAVPPLVERPEDLRGLVLDALCKSGVRFDGQTIGIEPRALAALIDHPWPGNTRELVSVVERAARVAAGERVRLADLEAVGFASALDEPEPAPALGSRPRRASGALRVAREGLDDGRALAADEPLGGDSARPAPSVRRRRRR